MTSIPTTIFSKGPLKFTVLQNSELNPTRYLTTLTRYITVSPGSNEYTENISISERSVNKPITLATVEKSTLPYEYFEEPFSQVISEIIYFYLDCLKCDPVTTLSKLYTIGSVSRAWRRKRNEFLEMISKFNPPNVILGPTQEEFNVFTNHLVILARFYPEKACGLLGSILKTLEKTFTIYTTDYVKFVLVNMFMKFALIPCFKQKTLSIFHSVSTDYSLTTVGGLFMPANPDGCVRFLPLYDRFPSTGEHVDVVKKVVHFVGNCRKMSYFIKCLLISNAARCGAEVFEYTMKDVDRSVFMASEQDNTTFALKPDCSIRLMPFLLISTRFQSFIVESHRSGTLERPGANELREYLVKTGSIAFLNDVFKKSYTTRDEFFEFIGARKEVTKKRKCEK